MPGIVRVTCENCGDKHVPSGEVHLRVLEAIKAERSWAIYRFICPECKAPCEATAPIEVAKWLISSGSSYELIKVPEEAREAHKGEPFTEDDVQSLIAWLDGENPLENP